jgi:hypothetical protein
LRIFAASVLIMYTSCLANHLAWNSQPADDERSILHSRVGPALIHSAFENVDSKVFAAEPQGTLPEPAITKAADGIITAFQKRPLVGIGDFHDVAQQEDFYSALVRDPRFAKEVGNVVVEFGDAAQQQVLDQYLEGADIPYTELRKVWADTVGWYPTVTSIGYINFFATVRAVNAKLASQQRIHVWLGDTPVDWSKVKTEAELPKVSRNETPAKILLEEILAKKKRALVLYGLMHFRGADSIKERVEQHYPGAFYIVHPYMGFTQGDCSESFERPLRRLSEPGILFPVKGSALQDRLRAPGCHFLPSNAGIFPPDWTQEQKVRILADMEEGFSGTSADAILYLGPAKELTYSPESPDLYMDEAFRSEIQRRVRLMPPAPPTLPEFDGNAVSPRHVHEYGKP